MGTTGTSQQNLNALGIRDKTAGMNLASLQHVHSNLSAGFGRESASAHVRSICKSAIFLRVDGAIACCQCLQSMQTTKGFLQATTSISHLLPECLKRTLFETV